MKWLDKKIRVMIDKLVRYLDNRMLEFQSLHFVTKLIITSPIWITIIIFIIKASRGDFDSEVV